jgi:hypothetical protein
MSPDYAAFGEFSTKSYVFSFGVILLEIVSGKKNNHSYQEHSSLARKLEYFPFAFYETRTPFTDNAIYDRTTQVWELWREDRVLDIGDSCIDVESYVSLAMARHVGGTQQKKGRMLELLLVFF